MAVFAFIVSILLMVPFLGWGIYTLRERYVLHQEIPRRVEHVSLAGLAAFCTIQLILVGAWIGQIGSFFIFTALSLMVASAALYGPMIVSVVSEVIVGLIHPQHDEPVHQPQFMHAEALEEQGDYDGALHEYAVMARVFPKDPEPAIRTANSLAELGRYDQAASAFERGLGLLHDADRALIVTNRLADIYVRHLDEGEAAERVLKAYVTDYPKGKRVESVLRKIDRIGQPSS